MTIGELCHALAVEPGESELDPDKIPDVEDMVSVCAGLVTVDDESNIIRLVHYTTQEYFERVRESWNPHTQQEIASACLTYLSFTKFASGASSSGEDLEARLAENFFFEYAATYWGHHVLGVQEEVSQLVLPFLQDESLVASTSQMTSVVGYSYRWYSQDYPRNMTGLHLAAKYGLLFLLEELLHVGGAKSVINADSKNNNGRTPLSWAAENGYEAVVKLLVEREDVDADSKDRDGRTSL